ncbi:hypothetical protein ACOMHN_011737 [Nucella lapillus]
MSLPLTIPDFMVTPPCVELRESLVVSKMQGVFCKQPISINSMFGPFVGEIIPTEELGQKEKDIDFRYAWHVSDDKTSKVLHVVNATKPEKGNWMRYVNSARFFEEQNIMSVQEGTDIYYKALKDIEPGEELLTWFEMKKTKKRKQERRSSPKPSVEPKAVPEPPSTEVAAVAGNGKRQRKKKVREGMVPVDHDDVIYAASGHHHNRIRNKTSSNARVRHASVPANKATSLPKPDTQKKQTPSSVNKTEPSGVPVSRSLESASQQMVSTSQQTSPLEDSELCNAVNPPSHAPSLHKRSKSLNQVVDMLKHMNNGNETKENVISSEVKSVVKVNDEAKENAGSSEKKLVTNSHSKSRPKHKRSGRVGTAEDIEERLVTNFQFVFAVKAAHYVAGEMSMRGDMKYACDICGLKYGLALRLKRHILRCHLNHKYLSPQDIALFNNVTTMSRARIEADADPDADDADVADSASQNNEPGVSGEGKDCPSQVSESTSQVSDSPSQVKDSPSQVKDSPSQGKDTPSQNSKPGISTEGKEESGGVADSAADRSETDKNTSNSNNVAQATPEADREAAEKSLVSTAMEGKETFFYGGITGVSDAFRCHLCLQLFPSVEKLKLHLANDAHRNKGDKQFACDRCSLRFRFRHNYERHMETHGAQIGELTTPCLICHKRFENEANMRKHLRFHSGSNFPCKHGCDLVYPNVAELVKHLEAKHPDRPRRGHGPSIMASQRRKATGKEDSSKKTTRKRQATKAEQSEKKKTPKGAEDKEQSDSAWHKPKESAPSTSSQKPVQFKTEEEAIQEFQASHPAGWTETRGRKPQKDPSKAHICPICKKTFSCYNSMCRHRRTVHGVVKKAGKISQVNPLPDTASAAEPLWGEEDVEEGAVETNVDKMYEIIDREQVTREEQDGYMDFSPPPSPTSFYENVADNVAENLACYMDGGKEALGSARQHIKVDNYVSPNETDLALLMEDYPNFEWAKYNLTAAPYIYVPREPSPPPAPTTSLLSLEGIESLAYPTRSAVAEREAARRSSVGAVDKGTADSSVLGERERIPRRASLGCLDGHTKDESLRKTRRASMGSFHNQESTASNTDILPPTQGIETRDNAAENEKAEGKKTDQSDKDSENVFNSVGGVEKVDAPGDQASNSENVTVSDMKCAETSSNKDTEEKMEGSIVSLKGESSKTEELHSGVSADSEQGGDLVKTHAPVSPGHPDCSDAAPVCGSVAEEESSVDSSEDSSESVESGTGLRHRAHTEASSSSSAEDSSGKIASSSWNEIGGGTVNGQMEAACSSSEVTAKKTQSKVTVAKGKTRKRKRFKPNRVRRMIGRSANPGIKKGASRKDAMAVSEKELKYLSMGSMMYAQKKKKKLCPHVRETIRVPARAPESQHEENFFSGLGLDVVKRTVKVEPMVHRADVPDDQTGSEGERGDRDSRLNTGTVKSLTVDAAQIDQIEVCPQSTTHDTPEDLALPKGEHTDKQAHKDSSTPGNSSTPEKTQETPQNEEQHADTPNQALAEPVSVEKPCSSSNLAASEPAEDKDEDAAMKMTRAMLELQIMQERIDIDREAEEVCRLCDPENTEFGDPSERTAKDFENIRFGRNRPILYICSACRRDFPDSESIQKHQAKKHPTIQCSYIEVESGYNIEKLFYLEVSSKGILTECIRLPLERHPREMYSCTRCHRHFRPYSRLRAHILSCNPNAPPTSHKKKPTSSRHRFMEQRLPDTSSMSQEGKKSGAVQNRTFRPKSQGTVMGVRANAFRATARSTFRARATNHKHPQGGQKREESAATPSPTGRQPSTRVKTQNWKYSPPRSSPSPRPGAAATGKVGRPQRSRNHQMRYNPAAHARRRDKAEWVDIHQCAGCKLNFRTLFLLERHTKNCPAKDKILGQIPAANKSASVNDKKHSCHYCPKWFKYLKGVATHYTNFCHVRAERVKNGGLTPEDLAQELELETSLKQQAWNKAENRDHTDVIQGRAHLHEDGTITHSRSQGGWPRGVKRANKRRRNGWTYIKRHKPETAAEPKPGPSGLNTSPNKSKSVSSPPSPSGCASGSATSTVMSELEARLREPVAPESMKRKRPAREDSVEGPSGKGKVTNKASAAGEQSLAGPSREKKAKLDDDLSQAPVIDRMDTVPPLPARHGKQMSPDLEPPILSPITPYSPRKRKAKRKNVDSLAEKKDGWAMEEITSAAVTTQEQESSGEGQKEQCAISPAVSLPQPMPGTLYVLQQVTDASGNVSGQIKLLPLNLPLMLSSLPGQLSFPPSAAGEQAPAGSSDCANNAASSSGPTVSEPISLSPNFLFCASMPNSGDQNKDVKEENKDATNDTAVGTQEGTPRNSTGQRQVQRQSRQRKKKGQDGPQTLTIKDLFKKRKSPTRPSTANTVKNLVERDECASLTAPVTCSTASAGALVTLPGGGMAQVVLPSTPILLPSIPSPTLISPLPLHPMLSDGKLAILDPTALPHLISAASLPVLSPSSLSPSQAGPSNATGEKQSPGKVSVLSVQSSPAANCSKTLESPSRPQSVDQKEVSVDQKEVSLVQPTKKVSLASPSKPAADIPNFLFDNATGTSEETPCSERPAESSEGNKVADKNLDAQKDPQVEALPQKTCGKTKGKKPKQGPPPSSNSPNGSRVKSISMMTSPGRRTLVSLTIPSPHTARGTGGLKSKVVTGEEAEAPTKSNPDASLEKSQVLDVTPHASKAELVVQEPVKNSSTRRASRAKRKTPASTKKEEKDAESKKTLAKEKNAKGKNPVSAEKEKKCAKGKKPISAEKEDEESKSASCALDSIDKGCQGKKMSDKKTVVLNVPVVKKRGGKPTSTGTKNSSGKQTNAANKRKQKTTTPSNNSKKHPSAAASDVKKECAAPNPDTKNKRKRASSAVDAVEKGSSTPDSGASKGKRKRTSAPTAAAQKSSATPNGESKAKRKRNSAAKKDASG